MDTDYAIDILKMNNMGVTAARVGIIQFLLDNNQAFTELQQILKISPRHLSRTTLYRTLISFCSANMLYKIIDKKGRIFYGIGENLKPHVKVEALTNKNNYHFQCETCGRIFCLSVKMQAIELPEGFTKTDSNLLLTGECGKCVPAKKRSIPNK